MTAAEVAARIREVGILPGIRVRSAEDALWAASEMYRCHIPIVELTMTVPGALRVLKEIRRATPTMVVGAGTVLDIATAQDCMDAGAQFITSPGLNRELVEFTVEKKICAIPGALSPSEIMAAVQAGADMIKVFPCAQVGGPEYIKAMRAPFPGVPFIASGGVNQQTAGEFIRKGASALGVRGELIPPAAIESRDPNWIGELAGRFLTIIRRTREEFGLA